MWLEACERDFAVVCAKQGKRMKKAIIQEGPDIAMRNWKLLFQAALLEENPELFAVRLKNARDAIVGEIEERFDTASSTDRRLLLAALNTISGLYETGLERPRSAGAMGHSA